MTRTSIAFGAGLLVIVISAISSAPAMAESRLFMLDVKHGALPAEQRVIGIQQGDDVILRWTTDTPLTVHLHGYDIERALAPGVPVEMRFTARATGRFPIERHGSKGGQDSTLCYLEVHPR